jgi:hypothetical protein
MTHARRLADLNKQEASDYKDRFVASLPARIERLRSLAAATGGPSADVLNLSVPSLDDLWRWGSSHLAWRRGAAPPADSAAVPEKLDLATVEPAEELPIWFLDSPATWGRFTKDSLWMINDLGCYLGEVVRAECPTARWKVGQSRRRGYIHQNRPVLDGLPVGVAEPISTTGGLAHEHLFGRASRGLIDYAIRWTNASGQAL